MPRRRSSIRNKKFPSFLIPVLLVALIALPFIRNYLTPSAIISISNVYIANPNAVTVDRVEPVGGGFVKYVKGSYWVITLTVDNWQQLTGYKFVLTNESTQASGYYIKKNLELVITPEKLSLALPLRFYANYTIVPSVYGYQWTGGKNPFDENQKATLYQTSPLTVNLLEVPEGYGYDILGGFSGYVTVGGQRYDFNVKPQVGEEQPIYIDTGGGRTITIQGIGYLPKTVTFPIISPRSLFIPVSSMVANARADGKGNYYIFVPVPKEQLKQGYTSYWFGPTSTSATFGSQEWAMQAFGFFTSYNVQLHGSTYVNVDPYSNYRGAPDNSFAGYPGFYERAAYLRTFGLFGAGFPRVTSPPFYQYYPRSPSLYKDAEAFAVGYFYNILGQGENKTLPTIPKPTPSAGLTGGGPDPVWYAPAGKSFISWLVENSWVGSLPYQWSFVKDNQSLTSAPVENWYIDINREQEKGALYLEGDPNALNFFNKVIQVYIPIELVDTYVYNPGLSIFKFGDIVTSFGETIGGGSEGVVTVNVKNLGNTTGAARVVAVYSNSTGYVSPNYVDITVPPSSTASTTFRLSVPNKDATSTLTFELYDKVGKLWDSKTITYKIKAVQGMMGIAMAYFDPGEVLPPAETTLIVRLFSSANQKATIKIVPSSAITFDKTSEDLTLPFSNDYIVKYHAKVSNFAESTTVTVQLYDEIGRKVSEYQATLYYWRQGWQNNQITNIDWIWVAIAIGLIILLILVVLASGGRASPTLIILILVVGLIVAALMFYPTFSSLAPIGGLFGGLLSSALPSGSSFGSVPLYIVLGVPGFVLLFIAGNMRKEFRNTATILGLLLVVGAVFTFMYASTVLVPFIFAAVILFVALIVYLFGRKGKTGPKGGFGGGGWRTTGDAFFPTRGVRRASRPRKRGLLSTDLAHIFTKERQRGD